MIVRRKGVGNYVDNTKLVLSPKEIEYLENGAVITTDVDPNDAKKGRFVVHMVGS